MPTPGEFEQLLLFAVFQLGENAYGVTIREVLLERTGRTASMGAIYTSLRRLEDKAFVSSRVEAPDGGPGRPRKFYKVQPAGARALVDAYAAIQAFAEGLMPALTELAEATRG